MLSKREKQITDLSDRLRKLSNSQLFWIDKIANNLSCSKVFERNDKSDIVSSCVLEYFGDALLIHHSLSIEPFSKDKFEYVLESSLINCGISANLAKKGNRGHDITINNLPCSLKTQADKGIKKDYIHISKFMELGKGEWGSEIKHLEGLRDSFFKHMEAYDRIFTLRAVSKAPKAEWHYELVEIPKTLFLEAANGIFEMPKSSQSGAKPGYCTVCDGTGCVKFKLYFDGGSERKLQIKDIDKKFCTVHASWKFPNLL